MTRDQETPPRTGVSLVILYKREHLEQWQERQRLLKKLQHPLQVLSHFLMQTTKMYSPTSKPRVLLLRGAPPLAVTNFLPGHLQVIQKQ